MIGEGMWTVHKAKWLSRDVAVKKFKCDSTFGNISSTSKEVNRMLSLRHPNILKLLGFYLSVQSGMVLQCSMIMELMDCDLEEYLAKGRLSDDQVVYVLAEVARGVKRIHEMGCFHRDLKPGNVLLRQSKVTGFEVDVKIADFGSSELVSHGRCDQRAGTIGYKAPEQFDPPGAPLLQDKVDAFGFGALCFKVLTGERPYETCTNVREAVEQLERGSICKRDLPEDVVEVIWKCLDTSPEARPDFGKISSILDGALADIRAKMPRPSALSSSASWQSRETKWKGAQGQDYLESVLRSHGLPKRCGVYFIPVEEFFVLGLVGKGSYGSVYKVEWKGILYAMKIWNCEEWEDTAANCFSVTFHYAMDESLLEKIPKLCHKNIVTFMGYSTTEFNRISMIMELQEMDLATVLGSHTFGGRESTLVDDQRMTIMREIAEGMKYLHDQGIVHGTLSAANVVLSAVDTNEMTVKLIDFVSLPLLCSSVYASPEVLSCRGRRVSRDFDAKRADVYSFGVLCHQILGRIPLALELGLREHVEPMLRGKRVPMPTGTSCEMEDLIRSCWDSDPLKRPTFAEICASFPKTLR